MEYFRAYRRNATPGGYVIATLVLCWLALPSWAQNVLQEYVEREEPAYSWSIFEKTPTLGATLYDLRLVSQTWKDITWTHQLSVLVPNQLTDTKHALLYVAPFGVNLDGEPQWTSSMAIELILLNSIVQKTKSLGMVLWQVPNQPLFEGKAETGLTSFTFDRFLETGDNTWLLLLPMTKSAVKAMDAGQEFAEQELGRQIEGFVVTGPLDRGWTAWLTGAIDPRVAAIAPMSIDVVNIGPQMQYQLETWGAYSEMLYDYARLNLPERINEPEGQALLRIVDPYFYKTQLTMPKLIFVGTNDSYWPIDALKFYFDDLEGNNSIHYVPNAGYDLGYSMVAIQALTAFFGTVATGGEDPKMIWSMSTENTAAILRITTDDSVTNANLWSASSPDRDFRYVEWASSPISVENTPNFEARVDLPTEGHIAFYAEVVFPGPLGGNYSKCTRAYVADENGIVPEPELGTAITNWLDF